MILTAILVLLGFLSLAAVLFLSRGRIAPPPNLSMLRKQMLPLDLAAFCNLVDRRDAEFLRDRLAPRQFRAIQRVRLLAAVEYIRCASRNAAILHQFGEAAKSSSNLSVAEAGEKLVNSAIRFRINALQSILKLYLAILMNGGIVQKLRIAESYERMSTLVVVLSCMQFEKRTPRPTATPALLG